MEVCWANGELVSDLIGLVEELPSADRISLWLDTRLSKDLATPDFPRECFWDAS